MPSGQVSPSGTFLIDNNANGRKECKNTVSIMKLQKLRRSIFLRTMQEEPYRFFRKALKSGCGSFFCCKKSNMKGKQT